MESNNSNESDFEDHGLIISDVDSDFKKYVSWMRLNDIDLQQGFEKFNSAQMSAIPLVGVFAIYMIGGGLLFLFTLLQSKRLEMPWILFLTSMLFTCTIIPSLVAIIYIKIYGGRLSPYLPILYAIFSIGGSLEMGFCIFTQVYAGQCSDRSYINLYSCNPSANSNALPPDVMSMYLLPILISTAAREVRFEVVFSSWLITVISAILCISFYDLYNSIYPLILYTPLSLIIICEHQRQYLTSYFFMRRTHHTGVYNHTIYTLYYVHYTIYIILYHTHRTMYTILYYITSYTYIHYAILYALYYIIYTILYTLYYIYTILYIHDII